MDRHPPSSVLAIGNAAHADFGETLAVLRRESRITFVRSGEQAAAWLSANPPVDWVMLFQSRPFELPRDIVDRLRPSAGSARFVSLLGSWCEGELRTGRPWPEVPRVYWHAFPSWWRINVVGVTGYALGTTGTVRASARTKSTGRASGARGHIAVSTVDFAMADTLIEAMSSEGWSATWWPRNDAMLISSGVSAGLWVGKQLSGLEAVQLDAFCRRMRNERASVVALLDFPRLDRVQLARRIGVQSVLGKPWRNDELSLALQALIDSQSATTESRLAIHSA